MRKKVQYDPSCYDLHLFLKPPLLLWIAMLYLSRAILLSFLARISNVTAGGSYDTVAAFRGAFAVDALIPSALASLVIIALLMRSPSRGGVIRWFVMRGNWVLAFAALLDLALAVFDSLVRPGALSSGAPTLVVGLDVYALVYVLGSRRVRDVFASYPAPLSEGH